MNRLFATPRSSPISTSQTTSDFCCTQQYMTSSDSHLHEYVKIAPFAPGFLLCFMHNIKPSSPRSCVFHFFLDCRSFLQITSWQIFFPRTAIDQTCGYDLLNPPIRVTEKKLIEPVISYPEVKKMKRTMLEELVSVCQDHLKMGKGVPEYVAPLNVAALIKERIEVLADALRNLAC
jgi:hypothetical protein